MQKYSFSLESTNAETTCIFTHHSIGRRSVEFGTSFLKLLLPGLQFLVTFLQQML
jgi:hypothetical protein